MRSCRRKTDAALGCMMRASIPQAGESCWQPEHLLWQTCSRQVTSWCQCAATCGRPDGIHYDSQLSRGHKGQQEARPYQAVSRESRRSPSSQIYLQLEVCNTHAGARRRGTTGYCPSASYWSGTQSRRATSITSPTPKCQTPRSAWCASQSLFSCSILQPVKSVWERRLYTRLACACFLSQGCFDFRHDRCVKGKLWRVKW